MNYCMHKLLPRRILKFKNFNFICPRKEDAFPYYGIFFVGEYEKLLNNIKPTDIVLDAGAHFGFFSIPASFKANLVIAVEPSPINFEILLNNIKLNNVNNIIPIKKALSNYVGKGYVLEKGVWSRVLSQSSGVEVDVTTIDTLLQEIGVKRVDVLKLDVEGSEVDCLKGFSGLDSVREIEVEVHGKYNEVTVLTMLKSAGFYVTYWNVSYLHILQRIIQNLSDFIYAELKNEFMVSRLILRSFYSKMQPIIPTSENSDIRLLYAKKV
jgi:FkbM family methyltransferase